MISHQRVPAQSLDAFEAFLTQVSPPCCPGGNALVSPECKLAENLLTGKSLVKCKDHKVLLEAPGDLLADLAIICPVFCCKKFSPCLYQILPPFLLSLVLFLPTTLSLNL